MLSPSKSIFSKGLACELDPPGGPTLVWQSVIILSWLLLDHPAAVIIPVQMCQGPQSMLRASTGWKLQPSSADLLNVTSVVFGWRIMRVSELCRIAFAPLGIDIRQHLH